MERLKKCPMCQYRHRDKIILIGLLDILDGKSTIPPYIQGTYYKVEELLRKINDEVYANILL